MGRVQAVTTAMAATLIAAASLLVAGCGGGDGDAGASAAETKPPAGFTRTQTKDFKVDLPSGWQVSKLGEAGSEVLQARPAGTDVNRAQLRVGAARDYEGDVNAALLQAQGEIPVRRPGATRVVSKPIDVDGAADARRVEWTVPAGGGLEPARIVTVLALSKDRTLVNLSVGVPQSELAGARIDDIVGSLQVR
jgi:hypothetical protein